jgi:hypothetical protein
MMSETVSYITECYGKSQTLSGTDNHWPSKPRPNQLDKQPLEWIFTSKKRLQIGTSLSLPATFELSVNPSGNLSASTVGPPGVANQS